MVLWCVPLAPECPGLPMMINSQSLLPVCERVPLDWISNGAGMECDRPVWRARMPRLMLLMLLRGVGNEWCLYALARRNRNPLILAL